MPYYLTDTQKIEEELARDIRKRPLPRSPEHIARSIMARLDNIEAEQLGHPHEAAEVQKRKVVISTDWGAGWSTWCHQEPVRELRERMLFDEVLIAELESGRDPVQAGRELIERMRQQYADPEKLDGWHIYDGGASDLVVVEVEGAFIVEEYDGKESIMVRDKIDWF